ncbi:fimbrial protein [Stenotrophomonas mori]|uniref:Fimbrial protein n=1 Tax=Stenotrophomonas mori TaxID=2871096 RepID=A0ABT0SKE6_9GAMM|nr:fimbrial protein [Stenotrophomonas mori]MCL7715558.1 fimbrial protein [Stenotrophomonas mori]
MTLFLHTHRASRQPLRARLAALVLVLLAALAATAPASAQQTCYAMAATPQAKGSWGVASNASTLRNGSVVASLQGLALFSITQRSVGAYTIGIGGSGNVDSNSYGALPLTGMPGLGVRTVWLPTEFSTSMNTLSQWPNQQPFSNLGGNIGLLAARSTSLTNYTAINNYRIELVVLDINAYRGGAFVYRDNYQVLLQHATHIDGAAAVGCQGGIYNTLKLLEGQSSLPVLPAPVLPTCRFDASSLNQNVTLDGVAPEDVAAYGAPRTAGSAGEKTFHLTAAQCEAGTRFNVYFTDAKQPASTTDYLSTGRAAVGMRLYAGNATTAVRYGPAPTGNEVPSNVAVQAGPTSANQSLDLPFTVQHVRLQGVPPESVVPGQVSAAATVTVVYP